MSFGLLAPFGLAALAALAVPILIHLVRRLELVRVEFAALRWLNERIRAQRRRRFERPWLLLLRLLLLSLLALLLARPVWFEKVVGVRAWVAAVPGVSLGEVMGIPHEGAVERRWLAPGFPRIEEPPPRGTLPITSLLRELDAQLAPEAALSVVLPETLQGMDGERPQLARHVDWHLVAGEMPAAAIESTRRVNVAVRYRAEEESSLGYLRAITQVWNHNAPGRYRLDIEPLDVPIPETSDWVIWLAPSRPALLHWFERGGVALLSNADDAGGVPLWRDRSGRVVARMNQRNGGRLIALAGAMLPSELSIFVDADFPERLLRALDGSAPAPSAADASVLQSVGGTDPTSTSKSMSQMPRPLDSWLIALIAIVFLGERLLASHRSRPRPI